MTAATVEARTTVARRGLAWLRTAAAAVAAIAVVTFVAHIVWLVRFRHGYLTEWDESGYLQFSLSDYDDLRRFGVWGWVRTVGGRGTFGPLLPAVTSLVYPITGRNIFGSLLVPPLFFVALVVAAFGLARRLLTPRWAVVATLAVATMPAVTDYARLFHFALPATACMTAAFWALLAAEAFTRRWWSVAFGACVGLTLLSRTMTVAYVPGFVLASAVMFLVAAPHARRRLGNLALAIAAAAIVAGPWYLANARSVYDLYLGNGYGESAARFGRHYPLASWGYWTKELRLDLSYTLLPLAAAVTLAFAVSLAFLVARSGTELRLRLPRTLRGASILALVIVVLEGYVALTSSRNEGTAFSLPWLPLVVVLGVVAAASVPARIVGQTLAGLFALVSIVALLSKSGFVAPLATIRSVHVPGLGRVEVTDGRGIIQDEVQGDGYGIGPITHPLPPMHREWLPVAHELVGFGLKRAAARHESLRITLGIDDRILGNSRLILAAQLYYAIYQPVDYLFVANGGDSVASYRRQLDVPRRENALVTGQPPPNGSSVTRWKVEAAARSLGFVRVRSFTLPDGRRVWFWWRDA